MRTRSILPALLLGLSPAVQADIVWTGAVSNDIFDEANWDLSNSTVTVVDANVSIADNVVIANTLAPVEIPNLGGQVRFQLADGFTLTLDNASLIELGNDGVGGATGTSVGPKVQVVNGSHFRAFFITNRTDLNVGLLCTATFDGGATPINGSTVNLTSGSTLIFTDETVTDYTAEHLTKTTVDGAPAVIGTNIQVLSDGGSGCIITVIGHFTSVCLGVSGHCPCGNDNDGSNGSAGCGNSISGGGGVLSAAGTNSLALGDLVLIAGGLTPSRMGVFFQGDIALNNGVGLVFGDGLRCAGNGIRRLQSVMADGSGNSVSTIDIGVQGAVMSGTTRRYQLWYGDNPPTPCSSGFNLTNAVEVTWVP